MTYNMNREIEQIAALQGLDENTVAKNLKIKMTGRDEWTAFNRREQSNVINALYEAKQKAAKAASEAAFKSKLSSGAIVWRKIYGEWMIQITGREVSEGDIVTAERRDGTKSDVMVKEIVAKNAEGIFARV